MATKITIVIPDGRYTIQAEDIVIEEIEAEEDERD